MAKTITFTIDPEGNTDMDIKGCTDGSCSKIQKDFSALGKVVLDRKKPEFYNQVNAIANKAGR